MISDTTVFIMPVYVKTERWLHVVKLLETQVQFLKCITYFANAKVYFNLLNFNDLRSTSSEALPMAANV